MIADVMNPIAPPGGSAQRVQQPLPDGLGHFAEVGAQRLVGDGQVWNGSLSSRWLTAAIALSPSALRSAVLAHAATPMSMCEIPEWSQGKRWR